MVERTQQITVSEEHIRLGEPGSSAHCPVALAVRSSDAVRALVLSRWEDGGDFIVQVNSRYIVLRYGTPPYSLLFVARLHDYTVEWIDHFDNGTAFDDASEERRGDGEWSLPGFSFDADWQPAEPSHQREYEMDPEYVDNHAGVSGS